MSKFSKKLFHCWHPVAYGRDVALDAPYGSMLLDEAIVVWRTADGVPHAMQDLCIHRGTALSLGRVEDDRLICPYHAWHYDREGVCVKIPQKAEADAAIPSKARVPRLPGRRALRPHLGRARRSGVSATPCARARGRGLEGRSNRPL